MNHHDKCSGHIASLSWRQLLTGYGIRILLVVTIFAFFYWGLSSCEGIWAYGVFGFWITLLAPFWIPAIFARNWSRWTWARMLLALPAMGWYLFLIRIFTPPDWFPLYEPHHPFLWVVLITGSVVAVTALAFAHRGLWRLVSVPLGISIICGTASCCSVSVP
jgi:hypothetical protein